jgi:hypothetical protein
MEGPASPSLQYRLLGPEVAGVGWCGGGKSRTWNQYDSGRMMRTTEPRSTIVSACG